MIQRLGLWLLILTAGGCATQPRPASPAPLPSAAPSSVEALAAAIKQDATRSDQADSKLRGELAEDAGRDAESCLAREPQAAACLYGRAVALGLEARAHPTRAGEYLNNMLDALAHAEAVDPNYDEAGPARVRALVLLRAPGWPLGPGDTDAALAAARRAVALKPEYPANLLALADVLSKTGDGDGARDNYNRARAAALALPASPDRDDWLRAAGEGLRRK